MRCSCALRSVVLCTVYVVLCSVLISVCDKLIHPRAVTQRTNTDVTLVFPPGTVYTAATSSCWRRSGRVGRGTHWRQARWWRRGGSERGGGGVERSGACVTQAIARGGDHVTTQCVNVQYQYSVPIHTCNVGYQCSVYVSVRVK
jgi:hypothetical protein